MDWREVAQEEGWDLFEASKTDGRVRTELERDDERGTFESDTDALAHVLSMAARYENGPHYAALVHWRNVDPDSYEEDVRAFLRLLPDPFTAAYGRVSFAYESSSRMDSLIDEFVGNTFRLVRKDGSPIVDVTVDAVVYRTVVDDEVPNGYQTGGILYREWSIDGEEPAADAPTAWTAFQDIDELYRY